jgi:hypothetical protein
MIDNWELEEKELISRLTQIQKDINFIKKENPQWFKCPLSLSLMEELKKEQKELVLIRASLNEEEE